MAVQRSRPCMVRPQACTRVECAMLVREMASVHALVCSPSRWQRYLLLDGQQGLHVSSGNAPVEAGKSSNARTLQRRASLGACTDRRPAVVWG